MKCKIIAVDIDATLTKNVCWTSEECLNATPNMEVIHYVNELFVSQFVIIYTGRGITLAEATLKWLTKHNVRYHAIKFEKMPYSHILDLDAISVGDKISGD